MKNPLLAIASLAVIAGSVGLGFDGAQRTSLLQEAASMTLVQPPVRVMVIAYSYSDVQLHQWVPDGHVFGVVRGEFVSCGRMPHVATGSEMSRFPERVTLRYRNRIISRINLGPHSRFAMLIIGPLAPRTLDFPGSREPPATWIAWFQVTTTEREQQDFHFGGPGGIGGVDLTLMHRSAVDRCIPTD